MQTLSDIFENIILTSHDFYNVTKKIVHSLTQIFRLIYHSVSNNSTNYSRSIIVPCYRSFVHKIDEFHSCKCSVIGTVSTLRRRVVAHGRDSGCVRQASNAVQQASRCLSNNSNKSKFIIIKLQVSFY